jgi:hypothetical protein
MKRSIPVLIVMLLMESCSGWIIPSNPNQPTPFLPPTQTPSIFTATPIVIAPTFTPQLLPTLTPIPFITATMTTTPIPADTLSVVTQTSPPLGSSVSVEILGCNTSIDVTHGMGEVTNAFVIVRNTGGADLTNLNVTLNALDEGRVHPDKTVELSALPIGYQVTLKLTVDSTYQQNTPIQIEVSGDGGLFQRVGADACKDIGVFAPNPDSLTTPVPNNP